jgi:hypothetical protein
MQGAVSPVHALKELTENATHFLNSKVTHKKASQAFIALLESQM